MSYVYAVYAESIECKNETKKRKCREKYALNLLFFQKFSRVCSVVKSR
jgi:hypothetical protein